ncbi:MAG: NAD-dependent succinate-semialdehyde dehydrogenase, partial [Fimbriimonadaceae bacterium]|nr:NAD-dependent succinate-semialdehyde dehydrogenase [Chitinophagales bacterium]
MKKQYINGAWVDAQNNHVWELINPATEEMIYTVPYGDDKDAQLAIDAAANAFKLWSNLSPWSRADILKRTAEIIRRNISTYAHDMVLESGKPIAEAKGEWNTAANLFEWFAEEGKRSYGRVIPSSKTDKRMQVIYQPMGVIGIITAWNFPAYNPARAMAAALAAGNTIVLKASEYTPLTAMHIFDALSEAGIPAGVANLINGEADKMGNEFLNNPKVKKISFTGSTRVGKILMDGASKTNTKLALELGGNAPVIIMEDVDIDYVAKTSVSTKFRNCGQICISPQRFYVHEKIYDKYVELVNKNASELKIGNGLDAETRLGPMINKRQQQNVLDIIDMAINEGNELISGGEEKEKGYFISPAIIKVKSENSEFINKEIFGPVLPVIAFKTKEEVIERANNTPYGLAAFIWTNNLNDAIYLSEKLEFGMVGINEFAPHGTEAPFGGWKQSGIGHESGSEGLYEYL